MTDILGRVWWQAPMTFDEAEICCQDVGRHLLSLHTREDYDALEIAVISLSLCVLEMISCVSISSDYPA